MTNLATALRGSSRFRRRNNCDEACGRTDVEADDSRTTRRVRTVVHLVRDDYTIGRAEENTVRLTERNISRRHARLTKPGERWLLLDLASYNGCYVNGQRVNERHEIVHGDLVQLGDYRLQVLGRLDRRPGHVRQGRHHARGPAQPSLARPARSLGDGGGADGGRRISAQPRPALVLGRGEECDVSINHPSVSRVHAEIQPLGDGRYEIVDRESANGVRCERRRAPAHAARRARRDRAGRRDLEVHSCRRHLRAGCRRESASERADSGRGSADAWSDSPRPGWAGCPRA